MKTSRISDFMFIPSGAYYWIFNIMFLQFIQYMRWAFSSKIIASLLWSIIEKCMYYMYVRMMQSDFSHCISCTIGPVFNTSFTRHFLKRFLLAPEIYWRVLHNSHVLRGWFYFQLFIDSLCAGLFCREGQWFNFQSWCL